MEENYPVCFDSLEFLFLENSFEYHKYTAPWIRDLYQFHVLVTSKVRTPLLSFFFNKQDNPSYINTKKVQLQQKTLF